MSKKKTKPEEDLRKYSENFYPKKLEEEKKEEKEDLKKYSKDFFTKAIDKKVEAKKNDIEKFNDITINKNTKIENKNKPNINDILFGDK